VNGAGERSSLEVERDALVSLAAPPSQRERLPLVPIGQALTELAELTRDRKGRASRLLVLERLVRAASRLGREQLIVNENESLRSLLEILVVQAPVEHPQSLEDGINALERALIMVEGLPMADAYRRFAEMTRTTLALKDFEVFAPTCNDTLTQTVHGHVARVITAEFFSELAFDRFEAWLDPKSWPTLCSWFFEHMDGLPPPHPPPPWVQWFDETVVITGGVRWTTRLRFEHKRRPNELLTEYRLRDGTDAPGEPEGAPAEPEAQLLVDEGFLRAQRFAGQQPGFISRLTMRKVAKFVDDDLNAWTSLMCDEGWLPLAIEMAAAAAEAAASDDPDDNG
jgi:hypothetical protein